MCNCNVMDYGLWIMDYVFLDTGLSAQLSVRVWRMCGMWYCRVISNLVLIRL